DHPHQAADQQLDRPEPNALQAQDRIGRDAGDHHASEQRNAQQQREADGAAEKLGDIGCHRTDLAADPHSPHEWLRELFAAQFGKVATGDDTKLRRQRLEYHRDNVGDYDDPEQVVVVFRAGLDIGREIAWIHVGDRSDDRRTGKGQQRAQPAPPTGQRLASRQYGTVGQCRLARYVRHFGSAGQDFWLVLGELGDRRLVRIEGGGDYRGRRVRQPIGQGDILEMVAPEHFEELQIGVSGVFDVVTVAALYVADIAGVKVGGHRLGAGSEHP